MAFLSFLFDYNGVLVDDEFVHLDAFRDVLGPMGITVTDDAYREKYLGFDDVGAFRAVLTDNAMPFDEARIQELVEQKKPKYLERAHRGLTLFPGAGELLRHLSDQGAVVGIVSGALRHEIELGLDLLGAKSAVRFIVSAEDTRACKPDPEGYVIGRARLESIGGTAVASRAVVVEDSLPGVVAALAAGLPCVAVAHSHTEAELVAAGATQVFARLSDITDVSLANLAKRIHADST